MEEPKARIRCLFSRSLAKNKKQKSDVTPQKTKMKNVPEPCYKSPVPDDATLSPYPHPPPCKQKLQGGKGDLRTDEWVRPTRPTHHEHRLPSRRTLSAQAPRRTKRQHAAADQSACGRSTSSGRHEAAPSHPAQPPTPPRRPFAPSQVATGFVTRKHAAMSARRAGTILEKTVAAATRRAGTAGQGATVPRN